MKCHDPTWQSYADTIGIFRLLLTLANQSQHPCSIEGRSRPALLALDEGVSPVSSLPIVLPIGQEMPVGHRRHCPSTSSGSMNMTRAENIVKAMGSCMPLKAHSQERQASMDPALQTHSASDSAPTPSVVRSAGHLLHSLCPVAFW